MKRNLIGVVGPCAAGKSTLVRVLRLSGISAKVIAQEHSYVPDMWKKLTNPDILVFLDASYDVTVQRKKLNWSVDEYAQQLIRLKHAREHAALYIFTDNLRPEEVVNQVLVFLSDYLYQSTMKNI